VHQVGRQREGDALHHREELAGTTHEASDHLDGSCRLRGRRAICDIRRFGWLVRLTEFQRSGHPTISRRAPASDNMTAVEQSVTWLSPCF
jgi:hypothetical protein